MPYYAFCILAGVDARGCGAVFTYDAVGSFERVAAACVGGAQAAALPILDQLVAGASVEAPIDVGGGDVGGGDVGGGVCVRSGVGSQRAAASSGRALAFPRSRQSSGLSLEEAVLGVTRAAKAAAERDIRLGDSLDVVAVTQAASRIESVRLPRHQLKKH
jgi:20S proteasome alpha/beta subunit